MSGMSVRDLTVNDAVDRLLDGPLPFYDNDKELNWYVDFGTHGWMLIVQDDGGDTRLWTIRLGELGEEL